MRSSNDNFRCITGLALLTKPHGKCLGKVRISVRRIRCVSHPFMAYFLIFTKTKNQLFTTTNPINYSVLSGNAKIELRSFDDKLKLILRIWVAFLRETTCYVEFSIRLVANICFRFYIHKTTCKLVIYDK